MPGRVSTRIRAPLHTSTLASLNCFLTLGLLGLYLKLALLVQHWGAVARFFGKVDEGELTVFERLGFFFNDLVLNMLVVPIAATALVGVLFRGYRVAAAFAICVVMTLAYFVELRAQQEVGQYISSDVLNDLWGWAKYDAAMSRDYVTVASLIKLSLLLAVFVVIVAVAGRARNAGTLYRRMLAWPATLVLVTAMLLAPVSYAYRLPDSPLTVSAIERAFRALIGEGGSRRAAKPLTFEQTLETWRQLTRTAEVDATNDWVGRERGSDLIIFMMETGPAQALDFADAGRSLPGVGPLYNRAFVARRHYTTHPYSSDAMYSVLSGLYPQGRRRVLRSFGSRSLNGLMTGLKTGGVLSAVYLPSLYHIELDDRMYAAFGSDLLYAADEQTSDPRRASAERRAAALIAGLERSGSRFDRRSGELLHRRLRADFQAMEKMKADITAAVRAGRRYRVMFFPEVGHGPWIPLHSEPDTLARGRTLMLLQDSWLKETVDILRNLGTLERTVIAVTGDHGVRTRVEDPVLPIGKISDYTFRVPLLIYAPQTLKRPTAVIHPTSHVDFAPTLLALFGQTDSINGMQGVPIWQRSASDRIYFLAFSYGGADGFAQDGTYYMRQGLSGAVYANHSLSFEDRHQGKPGDPVIPFVNEALTRADQVQRMLVTRLLAER